MLFPLLVAAILMIITITNAYGQDPGQNTGLDTNDTMEQKPTEEKQGGEYSGFEEAQPNTEGIPRREGNPTSQAPISGVEALDENKTTSAAIAVEPSSPYGMGLLAGMGAVAAGAIVAATWYFKKVRSK